MKNKIERLKRLVNTQRFSDNDKSFVTALSKELGVEFRPRPRCKDCYRDQAAILHKMLTEAEPSAYDGRKWRMREDVDIKYKGNRVNDSLLTDELAEEMMAIGLPRHWFYESKL